MVNNTILIAVFGRTLSEGRAGYIRELYREILANGAGLLVYDHFLRITKHLLPPKASYAVFSHHDELVRSAACLITIGGDGTLLEAVTHVRDSDIPLLGINTGRMGFLTGFSKEETGLAIRMAVNQQYTLDRRALIGIDTGQSFFGETPFALNEVTLHKRDSSSMITLHVQMDGKHLNTYWADGLIISTPTGSTGYSLSCGGPIIMPGSGNFIISPIAPHNLNVRPLVIPDTAELQIEAEVRGKHYMVALDSRSVPVPSSVPVRIKKAPFSIGLARKPEQEFLQTLREKLMWGIDKRN